MNLIGQFNKIKLLDFFTHVYKRLFDLSKLFSRFPKMCVITAVCMRASLRTGGMPGIGELSLVINIIAVAIRGSSVGGGSGWRLLGRECDGKLFLPALWNDTWLLPHGKNFYANTFYHNSYCQREFTSIQTRKTQKLPAVKVCRVTGEKNVRMSFTIINYNLEII